MEESGNCCSNFKTSVTKSLMKIFQPKFGRYGNTEDGRIVNFVVLLSPLISTEEEKLK
jgi:hypothetical protein